MRKHNFAWLLAAGLTSFALLACGGNDPDYGVRAGNDPGFIPGAGIAPPRFAYVANSGSHNVSGFSVDPESGLLTAITGGSGSGSPWTTGTNPRSIAVDSLVKFAYVANSGSNNVTIFSIASDGALTNIPNGASPISAGSMPSSVAVDPLDRYVYVANSDISASTISAYVRSSSTGALTPVSGSPFASTGLSPASVVVDPTGKFVYVANFGTTPSNGSISIFSIDTDTSAGHAPGALIPLGTVAGLARPSSLAVIKSAAGTFLHAALYGGDSVVSYAIGSSGALTPTSPPIAGSGGTTPTSVAVEPNGKFAYVSNLSAPSNGVLGVFAIIQNTNNVGSLSGLSGASATVTLTGGAPFSVTADPSGKFIYTVQSLTNQIAGFKINASSGALTALTPLVSTEAGTSDARFILITK